MRPHLVGRAIACGVPHVRLANRSPLEKSLRPASHQRKAGRVQAGPAPGRWMEVAIDADVRPTVLTRAIAMQGSPCVSATRFEIMRQVPRR